MPPIESFAQTSDRDHLRWLQEAGLDLWSGKTTLDLGCGSGFLCANAMAQGAKRAVGIDMIRPALADHTQNWEFRSYDLDATAWASDLGEKFDLITGFDIIEHVRSPYAFLEACLSLLKAKGVLVVTTPNVFSWERVLNPRNWSGARDPQHKILFSRYSLEFLLRRAGFQETKSRAPLRKLAFLGPLQPHVGGQIFCQARF